MELSNSSISNAQQLFLPDLIAEADEKLNCAINDEAIRKVVTFEKHPP